MDQNSERDYWNFYSRQSGFLGPDRQKRLQKKSIALIGLGGLGSHILTCLALYGIGKITIIDGDKVALHNLHRQPLYTVQDEGKTKTDCALNFCQSRNPFTKFLAHADYINQENVEVLLAGIDLIIDGTDSHQCTNILNDFSINHKIPLISASVESGKGYIGVFDGGIKGAPCHTCLFPEFPQNVPTCAEIGVDPLAVSMTANLQANLALKILLDEAVTGTIMNLESCAMRIMPLTLDPVSGCPACGHKKSKEKSQSKNYPFQVVQDVSTEVFIDVRSVEEFQQQPRAALNIPLDRIIQKPTLIPEADITLCCASGIRSEQVARYLKETGFSHDIYILDQGQKRT